jgi:LPXTG-site transpeptidase (sortase) family protein
MTQPPTRRPVLAALLRCALVTIGIGLLADAGALQIGLLPTSEAPLPAPIAAQRTTPYPTIYPTIQPRELAPVAEASVALALGASAPDPTEDQVQTAALEDFDAVASQPERAIHVLPPARAEAPPRDQGTLGSPGVATWLSIPAIDLEASVAPGGTAPNAAGELEWQTLPFVAVHYAVDTALIGALGNAVIAGHVVTLNQGNVFRNLYRVLPGNQVAVRVQSGATFAYQVSRVQLVGASAVEVMEATPDPELTLITCGGAFDQRTRTFDQRLVVVARLLGGASV